MLRHLPGTVMKLVDSVGSSYYRANNTAALVVSRELQQRMSDEYEATECTFAQAHIDHPIKPEADSDQSVLILVGSDAMELEELASDPVDYYEALDDPAMHLVQFLQLDITAYAPCQTAETPRGILVRSVNQPATVIVQ